MSEDMIARSAGNPPPGLLSYQVLTKRADFLQAARGKRVHSKSFVLQAWNRRDDDGVRVGFTCSKKVGNAVARNRAKRRLREIARMTLPTAGASGWTYVLIGRKSVTATTVFAELVTELETALKSLHSKS